MIKVQIAKVRQYLPTARTVNTKYSPQDLDKHIEYLNKSGIGTDKYHPIVVEQGRVSLLKEWTPLA